MTSNKCNSGFEGRYLVVSCVMLAIYIWWVVGRPCSNMILAHDFLDSIFLFNIVRSWQEGSFFNFHYTIPQFAGLPLNALGLRDLGIGENLYKIFSPFWAYSVNYSMAIVSAFSGMYLLGRDYLIQDKADRVSLLIVILFAFTYAVFPHKPQRLLGVSMLPLIYWAGANIWYKRKVVLSWGVWLLYPFYAFLHYNGFAVCIGLYFFTATAMAFRKRQSLRFVALTTAFGLVYVFIEIRSFLLVLVPEFKFESIRSSIAALRHVPSIFDSAFFDGIMDAVFLLNGHHHLSNNMDEASKWMWVLIIITACILYWINRADHKKVYEVFRLPVVLLIAYLSIGFMSFLDTRFFVMYRLFDIPLPFHRLNTLSLPLLLITCLLMQLQLTGAVVSKYKYLCLIPAVFILVVSFNKSHVSRYQLLKDTGYTVPHEDGKQNLYHSLQDRYTLGEYYLVDSFNKISNVLDSRIGSKSSYYTISLGLSPSKAQYHGFQTLDGYFYNYPKYLYDKNIRPLVGAGHCDSRLYMPYDVVAGPEIFFSPKFDLHAFAERGGRVIFSASPIYEAKERGLDFRGKYGPVHVYEVSKESVNADE